MADKKGSQAPTPQGAHNPLPPQDPPPLQNPQNPIVPNTSQAPEAQYLPILHLPPLH